MPQKVKSNHPNNIRCLPSRPRSLTPGVKRVICFVFSILLFSSTLIALEVPQQPDGYVTDKAGLLSPSARARLEDILRSFETKTSNQVVVVTFPSLEGQTLEDFSMRLAETWKVGQKGKDNGVIFLIFKNDRKMRIETGYGLEGVLPDVIGGQIMSQVVAPRFRSGDYEGGIIAGVDAIIQATQGEFKGDPNSEKANTFVAILVILSFLIFFHFLARASRDIRRPARRYGGFWTGGGGGGFSGGGFRGGGGSFGGGGASGGW